MQTAPITPADLRRSVIAVPPLCRNADYSLADEENTKLIRHMEAGGISILLYGGTNQGLTEAAIDRALAAFGSEGLVLVQNETNLVGTIIEKAHHKGLQVAINASPMDEKILRYPLELVDWLVVNEIEGAAIAGCEFEVDILPKLKQRYPKMNVLLTLGKRGAICARGEEQAKIGIYQVKVVDTTAAGDSFSAAYLAARLKGASPQEAAKAGHRLASRVIQVPGALIPRA